MKFSERFKKGGYLFDKDALGNSYQVYKDGEHFGFLQAEGFDIDPAECDIDTLLDEEWFAEDSEKYGGA